MLDLFQHKPCRTARVSWKLVPTRRQVETVLGQIKTQLILFRKFLFTLAKGYCNKHWFVSQQEISLRNIQNLINTLCGDAGAKWISYVLQCDTNVFLRQYSKEFFQ